MKKRIISAIIMFFIAIPFLIIGGIPFAIFITILGDMALFEFLKFRKKMPSIVKVIGYILNSLIILSRYININLEIIMMICIFIILGSLIVIKDNYHYKEAFFLLGLVFILSLLFRNFIIIRNRNMYELIYLLLITIGSDSFALFIGKMIGKHKLAPSISPNKTVEGFIGGCLVGTIVASIFSILVVKNINSTLIVIIITLLLSIIGEVGDLVKSSIKRNENVKDFSNLIPGHGGIMDRLDSILFVMLAYTIIMNFII